MLSRLAAARPLRVWVVLFLGVVTALALPSARTALAADSATSTAATAEVAKSNLDRILTGATPMGVADLKAMQEQVRQLTDKLMQCTVGVEVGPAQGSGVIISKDGYVLTAAHVAGRPKHDVVFKLSDGRMLRGKTLGLNRTLDAGLMKIDGVDDLPFAEMGAAELKLGQWCLATGHPGGYQDDRKPVLRLGRVQWAEPTAITTDCTLVGGDSGGPLFDLQGRVVGINSRIASEIRANMHVPVAAFKETWDRLNKSEAWGYYPGNEPAIGVVKDTNATDARVADVKSDSPAAKAGLKAGDIIVKFDGIEVKDFDALITVVEEHQPGDRVNLVVKRGEETKELSLKIGKKGG